jgi:hypothetical protein
MGVQNKNSTRAELEAYKKKTQAETLRALEEAVAETKPASSRVAPSILPTDDREKSTFSTIRQGAATNALTKVKSQHEAEHSYRPYHRDSYYKTGQPHYNHSRLYGAYRL